MTRPGKTKQLNISIPNEVDAVLDEVARKEHRSKSNLITHIILKYLEDTYHIELPEKPE